jgi:Pla-1/cef family extracellular lipase
MFPLQVSVDMADGATIDASSVGASNVFLIEAITPPLTGGAGSCQIPGVSIGSPCGVVAPLAYGVDYVAVAGADTITVAPLHPLKSSTTYVVAIGSGVLDSRGEAVQGSEFYEQITNNDVDLNFSPGDVLQDAINLYEAIIALGTGGNPSVAPDMLYSAAWTTASVGDAIGAATAVLASTPPSIVNVENTGANVEQALISQGALDPSLAGLTGLDAAILVQAEVSLPYYSGTPTDSSDPILNGWTARCDNPLATAGAMAAGAAPVEPNNTICSTINPALGDYGADSERYITKLNPVPKVRDVPTIAVQITVPNTALGNPAGPWPIAIVQHGITRQKEDMLVLTGALSAAGFATFAIDLPLHGSRGITSAALGGLEANASTREATDYMNLAFLLTGRDNLRQSMADLLGLRIAIDTGITGAFTSADFDTSNVQFVGMSLGAMTGIGFTQLANTLPFVPDINRAALSVPAGGVVPLLLDSASFGGLVQSSVLAGAGLDAGSDPDLIASVMAQFAFAAQTVIDGADPLNYAEGLRMTGTELYANEVVGGETETDLPDQTIPNVTSFGGLTFGGTEPLISFLGLQNVNSANSGAATGIVRFDQGTHGSLIAGDVATGEMQSQVTQFLLGNGVVVGGVDGTVVLGQ